MNPATHQHLLHTNDEHLLHISLYVLNSLLQHCVYYIFTMAESQKQSQNYYSYLNTQYGVHTKDSTELPAIEQEKFWESHSRYHQPITNHVRENPVKGCPPAINQEIAFNELQKGTPPLQQQQSFYECGSGKLYSPTYNNHICTLGAINETTFDGSKKQKGQTINFFHAYVSASSRLTPSIIYTGILYSNDGYTTCNNFTVPPPYLGHGGFSDTQQYQCIPNPYDKWSHTSEKEFCNDKQGNGF